MGGLSVTQDQGRGAQHNVRVGKGLSHTRGEGGPRCDFVGQGSYGGHEQGKDLVSHTGGGEALGGAGEGRVSE